MSSGRKVLAGTLATGLPGWQIISSQRGLDTVTKPGACVLFTAKRTRFPSLGLGWFQDEVTLWVLTGTTKPELIEDDLDDLLMQVLTVLEPLENFAWETAERGVLADSYDGYRITLTCCVQIETESEGI